MGDFSNYECINYGRCWSEAMSKQSVKFPNVILADERVIVGELNSSNCEWSIIFSSNVEYSDHVIGWLMNRLTDYSHRFSIKRILSKIFGSSPCNDIKLSIGRYLDGCYNAENGQVFNGDSISVCLSNLDKKDILRLAEDACIEFNQKAVILHNLKTGAAYFIDSQLAKM